MSAESPSTPSEKIRQLALEADSFAYLLVDEQGRLLDQGGDPKVTDFGLAKMLGSVNDETRAELTASGHYILIFDKPSIIKFLIGIKFVALNNKAQAKELLCCNILLCT